MAKGRKLPDWENADFRNPDCIKELANRVDDCACDGSELLYKLARIPSQCREQLLNEVKHILIVQIMETGIEPPPECLKAIEAIETNLRAAYSNVLALPEEWRPLITMWPKPPPGSFKAENIDWSQVI